MPDPKSNFKTLYTEFGSDLVDTKGNPISEEVFIEKMKNPDNRKAFFDSYKEDLGNVPDLQAFDTFLGFNATSKKPQPYQGKPLSTEASKAIETFGFEDQDPDFEENPQTEPTPKPNKKPAPYAGAPLSPDAARAAQAFSPEEQLEQKPKSISDFDKFTGKSKKELEATLQNIYRVLENNETAVTSKLPKSQISVLEKQRDELIDYIGGLGNPDRFKAVLGAETINDKIKEGNTPAEAYEQTRKTVFDNLDKLEQSYYTFNDKITESLKLPKGSDILDLHTALSEAENEGVLAPQYAELKNRLDNEFGDDILKLKNFSNLIADQKDIITTDFSVEGDIDAVRKQYQAFADSQSKKGDADITSKMLGSMGENMADGLTAMWDSVQEVVKDLTGRMLPYGADAHIYNGLKAVGRDKEAEQFILERYKDDKYTREEQLAKYLLPTDVTKPLFEKNVAVDGFNLVLDKDNKVVGARDEEGYLVESFTPEMINAAKKFESNPKDFKVSESEDMGQRIRSLGVTSAKVMTDMAPILATSFLSGGAQLAVSLPMFAQIYGKTYYKALEEFGDAEKAAVYATLVAGGTAYLETKIGKLEQNFGKALDRSAALQSIDNLARAVKDGKISTRDFTKQMIAQPLKAVTKDIGLENVEEVSQQIYTDFVNEMSGAAEDPVTVKDLAETIAVTTLASAPLATITSISSKNAYRDVIRASIDRITPLQNSLGYLVESGETSKQEADSKITFINKIKEQSDEYVAVGIDGDDLSKVKEILVDLAIEEKRLENSKTELGRKRSEKAIAKLNAKLKEYDDEIGKDNTTTDDTQDQTGIPSEEQGGEEFVKTKFDQESGGEAPATGGDVQTPQEEKVDNRSLSDILEEHDDEGNPTETLVESLRGKAKTDPALQGLITKYDETAASDKETASDIFEEEIRNFAVKNRKNLSEDELSQVKSVIQEISKEDGNKTEQLSQEGGGAVTQGDRIATSATALINRTDAGKFQDSTGGRRDQDEVKARETEALTELADSQNLWIDTKDQTDDNFIGDGYEAKVFKNPDGKTVTKINSGSLNVSFREFFDRVLAHNAFFGNTTGYTIKGFAKTPEGFRVVLEQPYVDGVPSTEKEIAEDMKRRGFKLVDKQEGVWEKDGIFVRDLDPKNVLKTKDGNLAYIDPNIIVPEGKSLQKVPKSDTLRKNSLSPQTGDTVKHNRTIYTRTTEGNWKALSGTVATKTLAEKLDTKWASEQGTQTTETKKTEPAPQAESKKVETPKPAEQTKEGFTEAATLNSIYAKLKSKYGDKKASTYYDASIRLVNPNKNNIVEIRSNGVIVKEGDVYIFKNFYDTDLNSKKWKVGKGWDVSEQFAAKTEPTKELPKKEKSSETKKVTKVTNNKDIKPKDIVLWNGKEYVVTKVNKDGSFELLYTRKGIAKVTGAVVTDEEFGGKVTTETTIEEEVTEAKAEPKPAEPKEKSPIADDFTDDIEFSKSEDVDSVGSTEPDIDSGVAVKYAMSPVLNQAIADAIKAKNRVKTRALRAIKLLLPSLRKAGINLVLHSNDGSIREAERKTGSAVSAINKGFYDPNTKTIHLNINRITEDTAIHEVLHPIISRLASENIGVFGKFAQQVENDPLVGQAYSEFVERNYGDDSGRVKREEKIVMFLGNVIATGLNRGGIITSDKKGLVKRVINFLRDLLKDLGIGVSPADVLGKVGDLNTVWSFADALATAITGGGIKVFEDAKTNKGIVTNVQQLYKKLFKEFPSVDFASSATTQDRDAIKQSKVASFSEQDFYNKGVSTLFNDKSYNSLTNKDKWAIAYLKHTGTSASKFKTPEALHFHIETEIDRLYKEVNDDGKHVIQDFTKDDALAMAESYRRTGNNTERENFERLAESPSYIKDFINERVTVQKNSFNSQFNHLKEDRIPDGLRFIILDKSLKNDYKVNSYISIDGKTGLLSSYIKFLQSSGKSSDQIDSVISKAREQGLVSKRYESYKRLPNTTNPFYEFPFGSLTDIVNDGYAKTSVTDHLHAKELERPSGIDFEALEQFKLQELSDGATLYKITANSAVGTKLIQAYSAETSKHMDAMAWCTSGESKAKSVNGQDVFVVISKDGVPLIQVTYLNNGDIEQLGGIGANQSIRPKDYKYVAEIEKHIPNISTEASRLRRDALVNAFEQHTDATTLPQGVSKEDALWLFTKAPKGDKYNDVNPYFKKVQDRFLTKKLASELTGVKESAIYIGDMKGRDSLREGIELLIGNVIILTEQSLKGYHLPKNITGHLDLSSLQTAEGLVLPQTVNGYLYLDSLQTAEGLVLPQTTGNLDLRSLQTAEGLVLPQTTGNLDLRSLQTAEGLVLPQTVNGYLYLDSLQTAEGLVLPQTTGILYLNSLTNSSGIRVIRGSTIEGVKVTTQEDLKKVDLPDATLISQEDAVQPGGIRASKEGTTVQKRRVEEFSTKFNIKLRNTVATSNVPNTLSQAEDLLKIFENAVNKNLPNYKLSKDERNKIFAQIKDIIGYKDETLARIEQKAETKVNQEEIERLGEQLGIFSKGSWKNNDLKGHVEAIAKKGNNNLIKALTIAGELKKDQYYGNIGEYIIVVSQLQNRILEVLSVRDSLKGVANPSKTQLDTLEEAEDQVALLMTAAHTMRSNFGLGLGMGSHYVQYITESVETITDRFVREMGDTEMTDKMEAIVKKHTDEIRAAQNKILELTKKLEEAKDTRASENAKNTAKEFKEKKITSEKQVKSKKDYFSFAQNMAKSGLLASKEKGEEPTAEEKAAMRRRFIRLSSRMAIEQGADHTNLESLTESINNLIKEANKNIEGKGIAQTSLDEVITALAAGNKKNLTDAQKELANKTRLVHAEAKRIEYLNNLLNGILDPRANKKAHLTKIQDVIGRMQRNAARYTTDTDDVNAIMESLEEVSNLVGAGFNDAQNKEEIIQNAINLLRSNKKASKKTSVEDRIKEQEKKLKKANDEIINSAGDPSQVLDILNKYLPKKIKQTQESLEIEAQLIKIRDQKAKLRRLAQRAKSESEKSTARRIAGSLWDALFELPRTLKVTADISAPLTNGFLAGIYLMNSPYGRMEGWKILGNSYRTAFNSFADGLKNSEQAATEVYETLQANGGDVYEYVDGLKLSHPFDPNLSEEYFQSSIAVRLGQMMGKANMNLIQASEAHMVTYLNLLRYSIFNTFIVNNPDASPTERKNFAEFVNNLTGSKKSDAFTKNANIFFLAYRYMMSRWKFLGTLIGSASTPGAYFNSEVSDNAKLVRKEARRVAATLGLMVFLTSLIPGVDIDDDPFSPSVMKLRIGDTYIDPMPGITPILKTMLATALLVGTESELYDAGAIETNLVQQQDDLMFFEPMLKYLLYRTNPFMSTMWAFTTNENAIGQEYNPVGGNIKRLSRVMLDQLSPLTINSTFSSLYDYTKGKWDLSVSDAANFVLASHGGSVNDYNNPYWNPKVQDKIREVDIVMGSVIRVPESSWVNSHPFFKQQYSSLLKEKLGQSMMKVFESDPDGKKITKDWIKQEVARIKSLKIDAIIKKNYTDRYGENNMKLFTGGK